MTETAYLYQYFLEHSTEDKDAKAQNVEIEKKSEEKQAAKHDKKYTGQHA